VAYVVAMGDALLVIIMIIQGSREEQNLLTLYI